ncbi:MAG TPA: SPFH domain-containing protein [Usitatibacteraceae bacterium]|nr:SPFH domain-containing protein [Usitatibacteraceae bacterium]
MLQRLINGAIAAAIAWVVTHSKWVSLFAFGAGAGLSGSKWAWPKEIAEGIKKELEKHTQPAGSGTITGKPAIAKAAGEKPADDMTPHNKHAKAPPKPVPARDELTGALKHLESITTAADLVVSKPKEVTMFVKTIIAAILAIASYFTFQSTGAAIGVFLAAFFVALIIEGVRIVPQQNAWVVERLGKFHAALQPGFNLIVPFIDRVAYRHSLKEVPLDVPEQVCITKDNTQLAVDGIIYFQVVDPRLASYGTSDYELAISQLAQTALRSEVGKMELDKTFESRDEINHKVVSVLDEAGRTWGIKVLRYEIKSLTPPESILRSMQAQITAEREKRALIAKSEGIRQEEINIADGQRQAAILASEGEKQAAINKAQGEATALITVAEATANAVRQVAAALSAEGGAQAANLKVAEKYVEQFGNLAKAGNTLILPANLADAGGFVAAAMTVLDKAKLGQAPK